jgi:G3E family GTPase
MSIIREQYYYCIHYHHHHHHNQNHNTATYDNDRPFQYPRYNDAIQDHPIKIIERMKETTKKK